MKAERWRYLTVSQCRETLTKPKPSEFDKRARVQQGFKSSINRIVADLKTVLGEFIEVGAAETQLIQRLSTRAASLWFDFCMHRCRIEIVPTGSQALSIVDKEATAQSGSLTLTVLPKVGRHGNVKGVELETFVVISGCQGDSLVLPESAR
jgi:hypothetical protein